MSVSLCEWDSYNAGLARDAIHELNRNGFLVVEAHSCSDARAPELHNHWRFVHGIYPGCRWTAFTDPDERTITLDPLCAQGESVRRGVILHEFEHALPGPERLAMHVCHAPHELPDALHPHERCSPVGYGDAALNTYHPDCLHEAAQSTEDMYGHAATGCVGHDRMTDLDRAEVRRAGAR
jgi:hypothetical protein